VDRQIVDRRTVLSRNRFQDDDEAGENVPPRAYRENHFPPLGTELTVNEDDPFLALAGNDSSSLQAIYSPVVKHWLPRVEAWASLGATPPDADALLKLKPGTMQKLMKIFPELHRAWGYGFQVSKQQLLDSAFRRALNGDSKLTTFLLSSVYGVREKKETEINSNITVHSQIGSSGEIGKKITFDDINEAVDCDYQLLEEKK
jgi:hypothetical protein